MELTLEQFRAIWPELFGQIRLLLGARRWAFFRNSEPKAVDGSVLVIGVGHGFHLASLNADPAAASIVARVASEILDEPVSVRFAPAEGMDPKT